MFKKSTLAIVFILSGCDGFPFTSSLSAEEAKIAINKSIHKECVYTRLDPKTDIFFNTVRRVKDPVTGVVSSDAATGIISVGNSQLHLAQAYALKDAGLIEEVFHQIYQGEKSKVFYVQPSTLNPTLPIKGERVLAKTGHTFRVTDKGTHYLKKDNFDDGIHICIGRKAVDTVVFDRDDAKKDRLLVEYTIKPSYYLDIVTNQAFITAFDDIKKIHSNGVTKNKYKVYLVKGKNEYLVENLSTFSTGQ